ncbi:MAG TPA: hypothetical protein VIX17_00410 [Pyrinomonadaceae bacterium]
MRTRTEITLEMDRTIVIGRGALNEHWCTACHQPQKMLTIDQAAVRAGVSSRTIFHWADAGQVHSVENAEGLLLICPNSIWVVALRLR